MIEIKYRASIKTQEIKYDYDKEVTDNNAQSQTDEIGKYPLVFINGVQIENQNIKLLKLYNDKTYPQLEMIFSDPTSELLSVDSGDDFKETFPGDDSILNLYKQSSVEGLMDIKMDFKITEFKIINGVSGDQIEFKLNAEININNLYLYNFESYRDTSYNILDDLSKKMSLGFASNIDNTNDEMVWINPGQQRKSFIQDIISHSYISDDTYLFGYLDFYYNFNYVDITKQLDEDISEQNNIDDKAKISQDLDVDEETPLILTNNENQKSTNLYIHKYTIYQNSTKINLDNGYRFMFSEYNVTDDEYNKYLMDSIIGDDDNGIILKGNLTNDNLLYDNSVRGEYCGKIITDITHKNYLHSETQNNRNLQYLQKLRMTIRLIKPNHGLYRFQKVLVELYNKGKMENVNDDAGEKNQANEYDSKIIHRLSGEWLITAINYVFSRDNGNYQEITLVKRELTNVYDFPRRKK